VAPMSDPEHDADRKVNIHAPWRIEYIRTLAKEDEGCFVCDAGRERDRDAENLLLWRTADCLVMMNKYPYTAGHLLIAPLEHVGEMTGLSPAVLQEMMELTRDCTELLKRTIRAQGFNVGFNIGRCAGNCWPRPSD